MREKKNQIPLSHSFMIVIRVNFICYLKIIAIQYVLYDEARITSVLCLTVSVTRCWTFMI